MNKACIISLGCPKNQVDSEIMLCCLSKNSFEIVGDIEQADVVIVNTCGFINDAKKEAIDTILYVSDLKQQGIIKAVVVAGCLAQRYQQQVMDEIPEVDAVIGIGEDNNIAEVCRRVLEGERVLEFPSKYCLDIDADRILSTPSHWAYLKIAEGCSNCCTYCAIPKIRGKFRSRRMENIIEEAKSLAENGVKELIVVAQDTTKYGIDLYGELKLADLLEELCKIQGIEWIRMLYCYPESITDELIDVMAENEKICNYIDMPLQHAHEAVLKKMNRTGSEESLTALIEKIRAKIPDVVIRTTFITGFPGETEEHFETLSRFVDNIRFDRLGCFAYSPEEDTVAARMDGQLDEEVKAHRSEIIMQQQYEIFDSKQQSRIDRTMRVIVDGFDEENMFYVGRTYMDAPEIDSIVIISSEEELYAGQLVDAVVVGVDDCDLVCEVIPDALEIG